MGSFGDFGPSLSGQYGAQLSGNTASGVPSGGGWSPGSGMMPPTNAPAGQWQPGSGFAPPAAPGAPAAPPAPVDTQMQGIQDQLARAESIGTAGAIASIIGSLTSAVGAFYGARAAKEQLKSQESALAYQQEIASINARLAENNAQQILEAGNRQIGALAARYTQVQGQNRASLAARGVQAGVGSARDIEATQEYQKQVDVFTMRINTVLQANAARQQRTQYQMQQTMMGGQQGALAAARQGIQPWAAPAATLLGSAGQLASSYAQDMRNRAYYEYMMGRQA